MVPKYKYCFAREHPRLAEPETGQWQRTRPVATRKIRQLLSGCTRQHDVSPVYVSPERIILERRLTLHETSAVAFEERLRFICVQRMWDGKLIEFVILFVTPQQHRLRDFSMGGVFLCVTALL